MALVEILKKYVKVNIMHKQFVAADCLMLNFIFCRSSHIDFSKKDNIHTYLNFMLCQKTNTYRLPHFF